LSSYSERAVETAETAEGAIATDETRVRKTRRKDFNSAQKKRQLFLLSPCPPVLLRCGAPFNDAVGYFQEASSRNCATDCLGSSTVLLHSVQTLTRTLGYVTAERLGLMLRRSKRVATCFRQA